MASSAASIANPARCAIPRIAKGKSSDGRVCIVKLNDEHGFEHRVCRLSITKLFNYPLGNLVLQWPHSRKSGNGVPRMVDESTTAVEEIKEEKRPKGKRAKKAARGKRAAAAGNAVVRQDKSHIPRTPLPNRFASHRPFSNRTLATRALQRRQPDSHVLA